MSKKLCFGNWQEGVLFADCQIMEIPHEKHFVEVQKKQVVEEADLDELSELLKLHPWQKDCLGYWFDHVEQSKEARNG